VVKGFNISLSNAYVKIGSELKMFLILWYETKICRSPELRCQAAELKEVFLFTVLTHFHKSS